MDREGKLIRGQNAQQNNAGANAYGGDKPILVSVHRITADVFVNEEFFAIRGCKEGLRKTRPNHSESVYHDLECVNMRCLLLILVFVFAPMPK